MNNLSVTSSHKVVFARLQVELDLMLTPVRIKHMVGGKTVQENNQRRVGLIAARP